MRVIDAVLSGYLVLVVEVILEGTALYLIQPRIHHHLRLMRADFDFTPMPPTTSKVYMHSAHLLVTASSESQHQGRHHRIGGLYDDMLCSWGCTNGAASHW